VRTDTKKILETAVKIYMFSQQFVTFPEKFSKFHANFGNFCHILKVPLKFLEFFQMNFEYFKKSLEIPVEGEIF